MPGLRQSRRTKIPLRSTDPAGMASVVAMPANRMTKPPGRAHPRITKPNHPHTLPTALRNGPSQ